MKLFELQSLFESIERDIDELKEARKKIPDGRDYSAGILESIEKEIRKLEEKKAKILNMEIQLPENIFPAKEEKSLPEPVIKTAEKPKNIRRY